ncbi:MAG: hypothetical protein QM778_14345 [Myxococcales bacterium]
MVRSWCFLMAAACLAGSLTAGVARAQDKGDGFSLDDPDQQPAAKKAPAPEEVPLPPEEEESGLLSDEQALQEERAPKEEFRESTDPYEDPSKAYYFVGVGWRYIRMSDYFLNPFLDAAPSVGTAGSFFGEFAYRKDGFSVGANVGWVKWNFHGPFQIAGDPTTDTEWLDTNWNLLMLTSTITWSTQFTEWMSLEYGLEAGVAFIFGNMIRTEAYPGANGNYAKCDGPGLNDPTYCALPINGAVRTNAANEDGEHYGVKAERGIANGGVPYAVPVLGPKLSLRFKPIHQIALRIDVPLPALPVGWMGGLSAQYGF